MSFKWKFVVELLQALESAQTKAHRASKAIDPNLRDQITTQWFMQHENDIIRHGPSASAFLSCLLPERRPDRVYGLQDHTLSTVLPKALWIAKTARARQLHDWKNTGLDFATCLDELVMTPAGYRVPSPEGEATLEEIDEALHKVSELYKMSLGKVNTEKVATLISSIMRRLSGSEAKWFVRLIKKDYSPVEIPNHLVLGHFHFLLRYIMRFQDSLDAAVAVLGNSHVVKIPHNPPEHQRHAYRRECARHIKPKLGVMIKRQEYTKAHSIKQCCPKKGQKMMSVERKYDGYHCQIHIDRSNSTRPIQIFSKSGKDMTEHWALLHRPIWDGLRLGKKDCAIKHNAILEIEMVVWNRLQRKILPFDKLRKYIEYKNRTIGADADSPRSDDEQIMFYAYDCFWHDNQDLTRVPLWVRRELLEQMVRSLEGIAQVGERQLIELGTEEGKAELREYFEHAHHQRWEGLVLKGNDDLYFTKGGYINGMKLKKDYIKGLGDAVDLCIVGGRKDPTEAAKHCGNILWTSFYLACLQNKEDVLCFGARPVCRILDTVTPKFLFAGILQELNQRGSGRYVSFSYETERLEFIIDQRHIRATPPTEMFTKPFVVEVIGGGYDKPQNASYYKPRHARVVKVHHDRGVGETDSFREVQEMAIKSFIPATPEEQEDMEWMRTLIKADGKNTQLDDLFLQMMASPSAASDASDETATSTTSEAEGVHPPQLVLATPVSKSAPGLGRDCAASPSVATVTLTAADNGRPGMATPLPATPLNTHGVRSRQNPASSRSDASTVSVSSSEREKYQILFPTSLAAVNKSRVDARRYAAHSQSIASTSLTTPLAWAKGGAGTSRSPALPPPTFKLPGIGSGAGSKRKVEESDGLASANKKAKANDGFKRPSLPLQSVASNTEGSVYDPLAAIRSPTRATSNLSPVRSQTKPRQALGELENVSSTRGLHATPATPSKSPLQERPRANVSAKRLSGARRSTSTSAAETQQANEPQPRPPHYLDNVISRALWSEELDVNSLKPHTNVVHLKLIDKSLANEPSEVRDTVTRWTENVRDQYEKLVNDETRARGEHHGQASSQRHTPVRRLVLFYHEQIDSCLVETSEGFNSLRQNARAMLQARDMKRYFVQAAMFKIEENGVMIPTRVGWNWGEAMHWMDKLRTECEAFVIG